MRVGRAFAFVDLSGFTGFTDAHGDEEAGQLLSDFRHDIREICSRRGVRVAKWLGDGAMVVAVEPRPLVEAVLEMEEKIDRRDTPLKLRAGMTEGRVIMFEGDDYIGSSVNLAARLCDDAGPHEILAIPELGPYVPPWAEADPAGPREVRGFVRPVSLLRLRRRECAGPLDRDPVCGMELDEGGVVATRQAGEKLIVFCSESCADAYDGAHRDSSASTSDAAR